MKTQVIFWFVLSALLPVALFGANVTFKINGLRSDSGLVWVGVYGDEKKYLKEDGQIADCQQMGKISHGEVIVTCPLQPGTYGAAAYHDENSNRKFDTNFLGLPKEGYGFPNNIKAKLSPPDFDEVLFTVGEKDLTLDVVFQY